ncbi:hypothetical protein A3C96_02340 [Candidatus Uhrbacteria bacterium RIFCSPHIGHO2_02_FULL_60_10]|uniref:ABC transporter domain-containing protein n=1 Tax=Candidatus Uhrbacteria bacterium RIFCSPHIGHO2_02_FULL_60_10 TaxID=1802392 RepID=A0A1F7U6S0_9BACT|nr:MAG: hypothetical protein A3C96_02340 [Candidatus Uhrbacteria bacterium RIFCSPHIGHO2_02_FULL_60_10]
MALLLTLQNISKSYGLQAVLRGVDAVIAPGWRVGVIGRNGAGKSTLARIIAGTETADGGQINRDPSLRLAHLEQHAEFQADETALEYLMRVSGRPEWECAKMADRFGFRKTAAAEGADAPLDSMFTAAARLSGGRATRLRLAAALLGEPNLLVLDEPTNFLDLPTQLFLEAYLRASYRGALFVVSHDREFLNRNCDRTWEIEHGQATAFNGTVDSFLAEKSGRRELVENRNLNLDRKRRQLEIFVNRFRAKASKATQAQSKIKQIARLDQEMEDLPTALPTARIAFQPLAALRRGEALHTYKLNVGYGDRVVARNINISLPRGSRTAILGENGAGKSTFLKTAIGELPPLAGSFRWPSTATLGYLPQLAEAEKSGETVVERLRRLAAPRTTLQQIFRAAGNFLFREGDWDKPVSVLSGGERSRLQLAVLTLGSYEILALDEPTTHLDAETSDALATALKEFAGTVVFVSHDRSFIRTVATELLVARSGTLGRYGGSYDEYLGELATDAGLKDVQLSDSPTADKPAKPDTRADRRRLRQLDDRLAELRREHGAILKHFTENPTDPDPAPRKRLKEIEELTEQTEEEWLRLAEKLG